MNQWKTPEYNLLEEDWLPVLMVDGQLTRTGVLAAFINAGQIKCITSSSPLDTFAIYRFLLTLLYWKADVAGGVEQLHSELLKSTVPKTVIDSLKSESDSFSLFSKEKPFLQDISISNEKERKSCGSLFSEMATGTNIAHFHHGHDEKTRLCLPCATFGLLRVVPWTQSGGAGLTPSIHNAPPIMALAVGDTLAATLGLNLVPLSSVPGNAIWSGHFQPSDPPGEIPYMEAFTWNPRRILLPVAEQGDCWYCGARNVPTIGMILYKKNEYTKKRADKKPFEWQDPAAWYLLDKKKKKEEKHQEKSYVTAKSTREELSYTNKDIPTPERSIPPLVFTHNSEHHNWLVIIPTTNPANNKSYEYKQYEATNLSPVVFRTPLPQVFKYEKKGFDGWQEPELNVREGSRLFVRTALKVLSQSDWASLANAAFMEMGESPAAFDVFSGLYWGLLKNRGIGLPGRDVAWLTLKLMAAVPPSVRTLQPNARFIPFNSLPKRQLNEGEKTSLYPVVFPHGRRLETALRESIFAHQHKRRPEPVDWAGLCHSLMLLMK